MPSGLPPEDAILALIPAYNEEQHIAEVVSQTRRFLPVLVVDDGSKDASAERAEAAGATVLRQPRNQGKGAALMAGYRYALEHGYQAVLMLDADGQHDPAEIPSFLAAFQHERADLIIGQRDFRGMPPLRRATNTFGTWVFSWAVGQYIPDNQSGYRLLSRRMLEATVHSRETDFEFEVEMIVICVKQGYQLAWVPIRTIYGDEKSHIKPFHHVVHFFRIMYKSWRTIHSGPSPRSE
jgi:glycosyltransferase involved in cell wall biosynthesis